MLFSKINRVDKDSAKYLERHFSYLERSARPEAQQVRDLLEAWFQRIPDPEKNVLRRRILSKDDNHFLSAFFEIYLHELLITLGYNVNFHPTITAKSDTHPDFLVSGKNEEFYLEAVLAKDDSDRQAAANARMNAVYDSINKIDSPKFFVGMKINGAPKTSPPSNKLIKELKQWLATLDYQSVNALYQKSGIDLLPKLKFSYQGWEIDFFPIPKSAEHTNDLEGRPIAAQFFETERSITDATIQDAIKRKASKYGSLDKPFIIAINVFTRHLDHDDVLDALFGPEQYTVSFDNPKPRVVQTVRTWEGAFISHSAPNHTRVSAILVVKELTPWEIAFRNVCLYHHPWTANPYKGKLAEFSEMLVQNKRIVITKGKHPREILGIAEDWPMSKLR